MKKILFFLGIILMLSSHVAVFAQMPVAAAPLAASAGMERIGIVAAAKGKVELTMPGQVGRIAQSGEPVFMKDEIKTDAQGNLQILLLDETVFTIGPNSALVIDEFVYDPKTQDGKVKANIAKGVFRYVSGKIAAKKPSNVTLKLPTATIGIRGTIVGGNVVPGGNSLAALLGPGAHNNAGAHPGSFTITGFGQNSDQTVNHTGFGVTVGSDGSVSGVFQLSEADINKLTAGLAPSGGGSNSGQGGGSATDQSGQGTLTTGENSNVSSGISGLSDTNNGTSTTAAQYAAAQEAANNGAIIDGELTTVAQLEDYSKVETGVYHYSGSGDFYLDQSVSSIKSGTVSGSIDINFGTKTIGGGASYVEIGGGAINNRASVNAQSFSSGLANYGVFEFTKNNNITPIVGLVNQGGVVAQGAIVVANFNNGDGTTGNGGFIAPRTPGATQPT